MSKPAGTSWDFEIFKNSISDVEKDRILALYCNGELTNIDWDKATADLKSASVNSMKVSMNNMWKKVEKAGGKSGVAATTTPTTPVKTPGSGKKRKSKVSVHMPSSSSRDFSDPRMLSDDRIKDLFSSCKDYYDQLGESDHANIGRKRSSGASFHDGRGKKHDDGADAR